MANPRTIAKIAARIHERAAHCIEFELSDPRSTFITITRVDVSTDLSQAKIFFSVLGTEGDRSKAEHMLADATGFIQRQVSRVLRTRRTPRLVWHYDDSIEYAAQVDEAISAALQRDRDINPEAHQEVELEVAPEDDPDRRVAREYEDYLSEQED